MKRKPSNQLRLKGPEDPNHKDLVLTLIKAELRGNKLIHGLEETGLLVEYFYPDLSTLILKLLDFPERPDKLYQFYDETLSELLELEVDAFVEKLDDLSGLFYNKIMAAKSNFHE